MARHNVAQHPASGDRRAEPRVVVAFPVSIHDGPLYCSGRAVDASENGVLIELTEPILWEVTDATLTLRLPASEPWTVYATAVRHGVGDTGRTRIALRMAPERQNPLPRRRSPSRRPVGSLVELGTRAYELAVIDPVGDVPDVLAQALEEIVGSLDPRPATARDLLVALGRLGEDYSPDQPR